MPVPVPGGLGDVAEGFEPLPAGQYLVEVTDAEERVAGEDAKHPGSTYIALEFTVQEEEYEGRKLWLNLSFVEAAWGMLKSNLKGLGFTDEELADKKLVIDPDDLVGRRAMASVKVGKNPKTQEPNNSVRRLLALGAVESELPG